MSAHKIRSRNIRPLPDIARVVGDLNELKKACEASMASLNHANLDGTELFRHLVDTQKITESVLEGLSFNYITPEVFNHIWNGILTKKDIAMNRRD
jgi:hypothetical protein